jgi:putative DNA methylase
MAKTKAELVAEQIAAAVGAGKEVFLESVDFDDPHRPKTCLEVDFPILPINQIAQIEGNAGKPIYQMSKWWARRRSSVFRSMLIAAAARAPDEPADSAKLVWDSYYGNHQNNPAFNNLKVADIFMGGGTTLVEGARLGMQMTGNDLNPVAWLVVKNELAEVDLDEVNRLFVHIEKEVKPQIMPFYACEGPDGEKGEWKRQATGQLMGEDFDPLSLSPEERKNYSYEGPEVIYTFWAKHGPCVASGCGHRTPLMSSPVVSVKSLTVKTWLDYECMNCDGIFDVELTSARMSPESPLIVSGSEKKFATIDKLGRFICPHCDISTIDEVVSLKGASSRFVKAARKNKKISLTLFVSPGWLRGEADSDDSGCFGGTNLSDIKSTESWFDQRNRNLSLIEVRGELEEEIVDPVSQLKFSTRQATIPKKSTFICQETTCGRQQDVLTSIQTTGQSGPVAPFAEHCFSKKYKETGAPYGGRYFSALSKKSVNRLKAAYVEWFDRRDTDLKGCWPDTELAFGLKTTKQSIAEHGYPKYSDMFNARQLLVLSILVNSIKAAKKLDFSEASIDILIGVFQSYSRNQNMFCFWNHQGDKLEPLFSNNNYHPKYVSIENSVFADFGRGNWSSCVKNTLKGIAWTKNPWDVVVNSSLIISNPNLSSKVSGKSEKVQCDDPLMPGSLVSCGSSTELDHIPSSSIDLVITDPPFGNNIQYAELADFFYVWLRLFYKNEKFFGVTHTPKALEAVTNPARNPGKPEEFFQKVLGECWKEAARMLKPGGILAFTFHHSQDAPWVSVLNSLFESGFYLEATYPIRSDETKGEGGKPGTFGSQLIEYDIIHVCRKRTEETSNISWARLRRKILADVKQLQGLLEHHQKEGLPSADIQVIKRGKALEYFSKYYGKVYVEEGREFTVKEALAGINAILDDDIEAGSSTPVNCEPMTRQFLRMFGDKQATVNRDQIQKYLRGSGVSPSDFESCGWCFEKKKIFHWVDPLAFAREKMATNKSYSRDMDQALILVGACYPESGISTSKILIDEFNPHPSLGPLLDWLMINSPTSEMRQAGTIARRNYSTWESNHQDNLQKQYELFGMEDEV